MRASERAGARERERERDSEEFKCRTETISDKKVKRR